MRKIILPVVCFLLSIAATSFAQNPDSVIVPGDLRIIGEGNGLVFSDGSMQYKSAEQGPKGDSGLNSLILLTDEGSGLNCSNGGIKVQAGLDQNRNGILDSAEVSQTKYICNGNSAYSISGSITSGNSGLPAVTVSLTGDKSATVYTDADGKYVFTGLANGNYTITPTKTMYSFTPANLSATLSNANATGNDFAATRNYAYYAYVTNFRLNTVSGYTINSTTGALTPISGSPFAAGSGAMSVVVEPSGKFTYVANGFGTTVSAYSIDNTTGRIMGRIMGSGFALGDFVV